ANFANLGGGFSGGVEHAHPAGEISTKTLPIDPSIGGFSQPVGGISSPSWWKKEALHTRTEKSTNYKTTPPPTPSTHTESVDSTPSLTNNPVGGGGGVFFEW
ncbi:hypothetical protein RZS08_43140, partial [Arthrospira platensis SPKY1]|nr:hypothetical protein [Arthrospira platensis SPKY1]